MGKWTAALALSASLVAWADSYPDHEQWSSGSELDTPNSQDQERIKVACNMLADLETRRLGCARSNRDAVELRIQYLEQASKTDRQIQLITHTTLAYKQLINSLSAELSLALRNACRSVKIINGSDLRRFTPSINFIYETPQLQRTLERLQKAPPGSPAKASPDPKIVAKGLAPLASQICSPPANDSKSKSSGRSTSAQPRKDYERYLH